MSDDQIEWRLRKSCRVTLECICVHEPDICFAWQSSLHFAEHRAAHIYRRNGRVRQAPRELGQKPAIPITIHKNGPRGGHLRQPQSPPYLQMRPKAKVFHPAIEARDTIESRQCAHRVNGSRTAKGGAAKTRESEARDPLQFVAR